MNIKINEVAGILADKSCSSMLMLLMDGKFHTVTELAKTANIKNHTATYHIKKFINLEWLEIYIQGRNHYYRLSNKSVAELIEQWLPISQFQTARSLNTNIENKILFNGRFCYDHLAGKLGVEITKWYIKNEFFKISESEIEITDKGINFFEKFGIEIDNLRKLKRHFCKVCMDWSERVYHIAGSIGKATAEFLLNNKWVERHGKSRGVRLTELGEEQIIKLWNGGEIIENYKSKMII